MKENRRPGIPIPFSTLTDLDEFSSQEIVDGLSFLGDYERPCIAGSDKERIRELERELEAEEVIKERYREAINMWQHIALVFVCLTVILTGLVFSQTYEDHQAAQFHSSNK